MFYSVPERTKYPGDIKGWPKVLGGWCHHLKYGSSKINIRKYLLSTQSPQEAEWGGGNEQDLRIPDATRTMVQQRSQESSSQEITGWATKWAQYCTGELKSTASRSAFREGTGAPNSKRGFSSSAKQSGADKNTIVQYLGIAADEPERIKRHTKPGIMLPLVEIGWDEAYCRQWCEENDLLSPIYTTATRGGCWFCHNQGIEQLRLLRKNYPEYWALMLKWDKDSPVTFHPDGKTVHDFERRFAAEDRGLVPSDRKFRWKMLEAEDTQD